MITAAKVAMATNARWDQSHMRATRPASRKLQQNRYQPDVNDHRAETCPSPCLAKHVYQRARRIELGHVSEPTRASESASEREMLTDTLVFRVQRLRRMAFEGFGEVRSIGIEDPDKSAAHVGREPVVYPPLVDEELHRNSLEALAVVQPRQRSVQRQAIGQTRLD
jgi:hypothetical protein